MPPQSGRIGADEVINDTEGKESEELEEILNEKEAKTRAILLEMVKQPSALAFYGSTPVHQPSCGFLLHPSVCCRWATSLTQT